MSYKFDSLMIILNKLDSREKVTVASLMNNLEVSERTVHRYLNTAQIAGYPIFYDRKRESYAFVEGFCLRKPHLSAEEGLAFALARNMLRNFGGGMERSLNSIEEKLSTGRTDMPKHIVLKSEEPSPEVGNYLETIHQAITTFTRIEIAYQALYSGEKTVREVDPYYLYFQEGFWHLRGYCHLREDYRTFALDRILSLRVLHMHFLPRNIKPEDELFGSFGSIVDGEPVEIVLRFDAQCRPYILRKKWHQSQRERELENGGLEVRFSVKGIEDIKKWIYRWIPHVKIVAPKELKETARADLKAALKSI